jgi:pyrroloquinoline quinone (PQQ) biosynthesis protein C
MWITSEQCVWKAPQVLSDQWPLEELYGNDVRLKNFFTGHLGVRECTIEEVLRELKAMSKPKSELFARLHYKSADLYQYLDATVQSDTGWDLIRYVGEVHDFAPL